MKNSYLLLIFLATMTQAQIINFPDDNFKAMLMLSSTSVGIARDADGNHIRIDSDFDGEIDVAEAAVVRFMELYSGNVNSIAGIENFINLKGLSCNNNDLTTLPISSLVHLDYLSCNGNQITALPEIENLTGLIDLNISDNPITSINLSNLNQLWRLWAENTLLSEINLCGTAARWLWATDNSNLEALYLKNNIVSSDLARTSAQIPPPLHNFEFYNTPSLNYICFDDGELSAVMHGIGGNTSGKTLTTSCDANCALSVENPLRDTSVYVYPNPSSGIINIEISNNQPTIKTTINNLLGQTILTFENTTMLDVTSLTKGTYLITVETDNGKETQRIIKQ